MHTTLFTGVRVNCACTAWTAAVYSKQCPKDCNMILMQHFQAPTFSFSLQGPSVNLHTQTLMHASCYNGLVERRRQGTGSAVTKYKIATRGCLRMAKDS